jgi:hypothetical protein
MTSATDIIECPLCRVPHRGGASRCDACGQPLDEPPDVRALNAERLNRKLQLLGALASILLMLVLNFWVFGGEAYAVALAPFGWLLWAWRRLHALNRNMARLAEEATKRSQVPIVPS